MKKIKFWLLIDVLWYIIYYAIAINKIYTYEHSYGWSGEDRGMRVIFDFFLILGSLFFVLFQWIDTSLNFSIENDNNKLFFRKKIIFSCQNIFLFFFPVWGSLNHFLNSGLSYFWPMTFLGFIIISPILYIFTINFLNKHF